MNDAEIANRLLARLYDLQADERRHLLELLEAGTILDCERREPKPKRGKRAPRPRQ